MAATSDPSTLSALLNDCQTFQQQIIDLQTLSDKQQLDHRSELAQLQEEVDELRLLNSQWRTKYHDLLMRSDTQRKQCEQKLDRVLNAKTTDVAQQPLLCLSAPINRDVLPQEPEETIPRLASPDLRLVWQELDNRRFEELGAELGEREDHIRNLEKKVALLEMELSRRDTVVTQLRGQLSAWLLTPDNKQHIQQRTQQLEDQLLFLQQQNGKLEADLTTARTRLEQLETNQSSQDEQMHQYMDSVHTNQTQFYQRLVHLDALVADLELVDLKPIAQLQRQDSSPTVTRPGPDVTQLQDQLTEVTQDRDNLKQLYHQLTRELQTMRYQAKARDGQRTVSRSGSTSSARHSVPSSSVSSPVLSHRPVGDSTRNSPPDSPNHSLSLLQGDIRALLRFTQSLVNQEPLSSTAATPVQCVSEAAQPLAEALSQLQKRLHNIQHSSAKSTLSRNQEEYRVLTQRFEQQARELTRLEKDYLQLTSEHQSTLQELAQARQDSFSDRVRPTEPEDDSQVKHRRDETRRLQNELNRLVERHQALTHEHEQVDKAFKEAIQEVDRLRAAYDAAHKQKGSLQAYLDEVQSENKQCQQELAAVKKQNRHIQSSVASLEALSAQTQKDKASLSRELGNLQDLLRATELSKDEYKKHALTLSHDLEQLKLCLRQIQVEKDGLTIQLRSMTHQLQRYQQCRGTDQP
ncbi:hypothetical protein IWQ62_004293 [Dispira parvispora]|uniref:Uncharacterized protein n=1 Tax=Dispira parvispora TaxID=1520584 RepID=A0A9W8E244_9FUNG|nr:hypothetical protein IWQ62_004293 [Dispira parvispora]